MRRVSILIFILSVLLPPQIASAQSSNAGIVQGLWYSQDKVFVGEQTRIYVAVRNNTGGDLTGIVEFYVNDKKIERKNVEALSGRIVESWADWVPLFGTSTLRATLSRTEIEKVGSSTQAVAVTAALAEDTLFVDYDTDKDGIGNAKDANDDNDSFTDAEEQQNGTDPLVQNKTEVQTEASAEKEEVKDEAETADKDSNEVTTQDSSEGLEQYLAPSRAETVLSSVTQYVDTAKQKVDSYREKRAEINAAELKKDAGVVTVNEDGFGEITRSDNSDTTKNQSQKEGGGFLDKIVTLLSSLFSSIYTILLWLVSLVLAHPMFVQLALLLGLLFIIIRLASKFGSRKNRQ